MENKPALLTLNEAAQMTGIGRETWKKWSSTDRLPIPKIKINRLVRFRRRDVEDLVAGRPIQAAATRRRGRPSKLEKQQGKN